MDALRATKFTEIYKRLDDSVTDYPLESALVDLHQYFLAGTLIGAIQDIQKSTGTQQDKAETDKKTADAAKAAVKTKQLDLQLQEQKLRLEQQLQQQKQQ
jgi:hypothetical protein